MPISTDIELDRETYKVYEWRMQWLQAGGWSKRNAGLIAGTNKDWRYANTLLSNMLAKGHTEEEALELLL